MWRKLINDIKNADDIEEIVNNYIEKSGGIEAINKLRNIVDEAEIPEYKRVAIIKILIESIDNKIYNEVYNEKIIDLINISRRKVVVSKVQLESILSKESLTKAVNLRGKVFRKNFIYSTLEDGKTLLDKAVEKQNAGMIWLLLRSIIKEITGDCVLERHLTRGVRVNATDWIVPALMCAALTGHEDMVEYLVERGAVVNATDWMGPALMCSVLTGHENIVRYLVEQGADADARNNICTALMEAASGGHENIVRYLVEQGAVVNRYYLGETALSRAAGGGHENIVRYLVERGAVVTSETLWEAASGGHENIVRYLVEQGADVNMYRKALSRAARGGHENIVKYLVEQAAVVSAWTVVSKALIDIIEYGHENIVKYLVEQGADVNIKNSYEETALMYAVKFGHENIVKYLVEQGADVNIKNSYEETALIYAVKFGHENIVKYLVEQGADVNAKDRYENIVRCLVEQSDSTTVRFKRGKDKKEVNNIIEALFENESSIFKKGIETIDVREDKVVLRDYTGKASIRYKYKIRSEGGYEFERIEKRTDRSLFMKIIRGWIRKPLKRRWIESTMQTMSYKRLKEIIGNNVNEIERETRNISANVNMQMTS